MKRTLVIVLNLFLWIGLAVYLVVALRYTSQTKRQTTCRAIEVHILDSSQRQFITPAMVKAWFVNEKIPLIGREQSRINTLSLKTMIEKRGFVSSARVYHSMDGVLNIDITQRTPILRVNTRNGYNFYITDDLYVLPAQHHFVVYVPLITGYIIPPFGRDYVGPIDRFARVGEKKLEKNYLFLLKLIKFVKFVEDNDFWRSFIVQIEVDGAQEETDTYDPDVEITPRLGNQVILMGSLDDYPDKLDKLLGFYKHAMIYEGWERYSFINLKYKNQIICRK